MARNGLKNWKRIGIASLGALTLVWGDDLKTPAPQSNPGSQPRVAIETRQPRPSAGDAGGARRNPNFRSDLSLVQINVTVMTPTNQIVTSMEKEHFRIFEDQVEQAITSFSSEELPISVGLVFDISGSMSNKTGSARQAAQQFFKYANPDDEFFLVQFNDRPELVVPFTTRTEDILYKMAFTRTRGSTALLDGVYLAMNQMKKARNPRKAILVLSDGGDNSSRYTESEIKNAVREADVVVYAIGIYGGGNSIEERNGPGLLGDLAKNTGGAHFPVGNLAHLADIGEKIGLELRSHYILGYSSSNPQKDGKYRRVEVKVVQPRGLPKLRAYYRQGYYAPSE